MEEAVSSCWRQHQWQFVLIVLATVTRIYNSDGMLNPTTRTKTLLASYVLIVQQSHRPLDLGPGTKHCLDHIQQVPFNVLVGDISMIAMIDCPSKTPTWVNIQ
jgi:hypothetical protein